MKRRASALLLAAAALALTGCDADPEYSLAEPVESPDQQQGQQEQSQALSDALASIDCTGQRPASLDEPGLLQAGECVPYEGSTTIEYYEFDSQGTAEAWVRNGAEVTDVDGIYRDGAIVIIDRNNDYMMQLAMQFQPAA